MKENDRTGADLKAYIENVFNLEVSLFNQKQLYDKTQSKIGRLSSMDEKDLKALQPVKWRVIFPYGLLSAVIGAAIGLLISVLFSSTSSHPAAAEFFRIIMGAGIAFGVYFAYWLFNVIRIIQKNRAIEQENRQIAAEALREKQQLEQELVKIRLLYQKNRNLLNRYYSMDIIPVVYRQLSPVSAFYDYLSSGRCATLSGPDGACHIYESERPNEIIGKLDELIERHSEIAGTFASPI